MLDIQSHFIAIKTVWVKHILSSSAPWSIIGKDIITKFNKNGLLLYVNYPEINYLEKLPLFYKQVYQGLIKTNSIELRKIKTLTVLLNPVAYLGFHFGGGGVWLKKFLEKWWYLQFGAF